MKAENGDRELDPKVQAASRRHFLRCSGGATAATMAAWQLMSQKARADPGGGGGSSGGSSYGAIVIGTLTAGSGS